MRRMATTARGYWRLPTGNENSSTSIPSSRIASTCSRTNLPRHGAESSGVMFVTTRTRKAASVSAAPVPALRGGAANFRHISAAQSARLSLDASHDPREHRAKSEREEIDARKARRIHQDAVPAPLSRDRRRARGRAGAGHGRVRRPDPARLAPDDRDGGRDEGIQRQAGHRARRPDRPQDHGGGERDLVQVGVPAGTPRRFHGTAARGPPPATIPPKWPGGERAAAA